jgi:hypothetical protein
MVVARLRDHFTLIMPCKRVGARAQKIFFFSSLSAQLPEAQKINNRQAEASMK